MEKKLSVLGRVCRILNLERRRSLMKAFIESQFEYCPLVCIVCGRQENNPINHLHERALRIVYNESAFENLLELDNWVSIHHRNIRLLSIDLYKVQHNLSYQVISELSNLRNVNYDFRSQTDFELRPTYTTTYGLPSLKYFALKIWNIVPIGSRNSDSLSEFTTKIKSWKPVTCPCSLCRTFVGHEGLLLNMYTYSLAHFNYFVVTKAATERCFLKMAAPNKLIKSLGNTCERFFW